MWAEAADSHKFLAMPKKAAPRFKETKRLPTQFRAWRKHRGLTLEAAADRMGMTAGNLSAMERGAQGYTQAGLEAMAQAYNAEPGWLLHVDPTNGEAIWSIWEQAKPAERQQIMAVVRALTKAG